METQTGLFGNQGIFYWIPSPPSIFRDGDIWLVPFLLVVMAFVGWRWWSKRKTKMRFDPERDFDFDANDDDGSTVRDVRHEGEDDIISKHAHRHPRACPEDLK